MSRLIREDDKEKKGPEGIAALLPLSNSTVVSHLKACQSLTAEHARDTFRSYVRVLDDALTHEINQAKSNREAQEIAESQRQLRQQADDLERYFCGYLSEGFVKFKKRELHTNFGMPDDNETELSLIGNEELEETIAISSITQRADAYFAEPLWALNQRFAVLNGGEHVTEANNPAAPIQFCESLRKALKLLPMSNRAKSVAYKVYDDQLFGLIKTVSEEINGYLKQQGVLPNLRYKVPSGNAPVSFLAGGAQAGAEAPVSEEQQLREAVEKALGGSVPHGDYENSLFQAIRGLQSQIADVPAANDGGGGSSGETGDEGNIVIPLDTFLGALQILQGQSSMPVAGGTLDGQQLVPVDVADVVKQLTDQVLADNGKAAVPRENMQTIDLVGMVFEYMLNDENLPDSIKALLSYLHTPFLKVAFVDPGFFEQPEHPARLLLNNLAEAGARWVGNDGSSQYDIYNKIRDVVNRVLKDFDNDIKVITELLLEFSGYTKNIMRRQDLMEKRATEKAQGEEKLREVKLKVNNEVRDRTSHKELPSAVLLFLLQPWSDYLSFALLRYGEKSDKWNKALAVVDDVLWAIEPKEDSREKSRQVEMHDELISAIQAGFETIGYDQVKGKKLIDAISSLIRLALQSKKAEPAPAPMRNKLERIAAEKAGNKDISPIECSPEEAQMVESLKMIEFGTWFEFSSGRRLKVAWYNARTSHYMLVDQMGKRVDMMSGLTMARQMISGEAKIISGSSKPFFERALENIFQKLNEKAESINPGETNERE